MTTKVLFLSDRMKLFFYINICMYISSIFCICIFCKNKRQGYKFVILFNYNLMVSVKLFY